MHNYLMGSERHTLVNMGLINPMFDTYHHVIDGSVKDNGGVGNYQ